MYYFEIYAIDLPGIITRRFLLPFARVEDAIAWVETIVKNGEGYYIRWRENV